MITKRTFGGLMAAGLAATLLSAPALAADMTLKLGHLANEENPWHLASVKFGEELAARLPRPGRLEVIHHRLDRGGMRCRVRPDVGAMRLLSARRQHRHRRFVCMQDRVAQQTGP